MKRRMLVRIGAALFGALITAPLVWPTPQQGPKFAKWEKFDQQLYRYKIKSGWLVRYGSNTVTFVPDAKHEWSLKKKKK